MSFRLGTLRMRGHVPTEVGTPAAGGVAGLKFRGFQLRAIPAQLRWFWLFPALLLAGCAEPTNPSFPVTIDQAITDVDRMQGDRRSLARPVVVIAGMMDPGVESAMVKKEIESISKGAQVIPVMLANRFSFAGYREKVLDAIEHALPPDKTGQRPEADVVGFSLGGLAARYAALPLKDGRAPLHIARLFTISTPHRGAALVQDLPPLLEIERDLRPGSARLAELDAAARAYPIYSYVRLGDHVVGPENAAPPGARPWWVYTPTLNGPHVGAPMDPRIIADIDRRLRGETPLSSDPPSPLPVQ